MAGSLISSLEKLHLEAGSADSIADDWIDHILEEPRPRKRVRQDSESLKKELEQNFLTPSPTFSPEWLNRLQQ